MTPLSVSEGMPDSTLEITSGFGGEGFDLNVLRILPGVLHSKRFQQPQAAHDRVTPCQALTPRVSCDDIASSIRRTSSETTSVPKILFRAIPNDVGMRCSHLPLLCPRLLDVAQ